MAHIVLFDIINGGRVYFSFMFNYQVVISLPQVILDYFFIWRVQNAVWSFDLKILEKLLLLYVFFLLFLAV